VDEQDEAIQPAETARDKRRDHRAAAAERAGMRTGLAKQFKQVLDAQVKRAAEAERDLEELRGRPDDSDDSDERARAGRTHRSPGHHHLSPAERKGRPDGFV
jgi:hypothetical protein